MSRVDRAHRRAIRDVLKDAPGPDAADFRCRDWYARNASRFHELREEYEAATASRRGGARR